MADMTMGQRIAECRKKLGLSQEALGEKMGVSRQAISKWEADGAVPEIDKLVAMSKLFGVSVGWLLGVEEEPAVPNPDPGFTEEQMKIVEGIAERYAKPQKRDRTLLAVIGCCAVVVLLVCVAVFITFLNYVNQEISNLYGINNALSTRFWNIDEQFGLLSDKLDELAAGEKLLSEYTLEAAAWEDMTGATVRFTALPNNTQAGDQAWLSVRLDGAEVANALCTMDGSAYTASIDLPAANGYSYYFQVVHTGGGSSQQPLAEADHMCENLKSALSGSLYVDIPGYFIGGGRLGISTQIYRESPYLEALGTPVTWSRVELVLFLNGEELERLDMLEYTDGAMSRSMVWEQVDTDVSFAIPDLAEGDVLLLSIEADLSNGTTLDRPVADWTVEADGSMSWAKYTELR